MTFPNYLKRYLRSVSHMQTLSVRALYKKSKENIRIIDPLILYCYYNGKTEILNSITEEFTELFKKIEKSNNNFQNFEEYSFEKIHDSYINYSKKVDYDLDIKKLMRENILNLKKEKKISTYRLYKELNLNPGNVNAFIKNGDLKKLSIENTKRIIYFLYEN